MRCQPDSAAVVVRASLLVGSDASPRFCCQGAVVALGHGKTVRLLRRCEEQLGAAVVEFREGDEVRPKRLSGSAFPCAYGVHMDADKVRHVLL